MKNTFITIFAICICCISYAQQDTIANIVYLNKASKQLEIIYTGKMYSLEQEINRLHQLKPERIDGNALRWQNLSSPYWHLPGYQAQMKFSQHPKGWFITIGYQDKDSNNLLVLDNFARQASNAWQQACLKALDWERTEKDEKLNRVYVQPGKKGNEGLESYMFYYSALPIHLALDSALSKLLTQSETPVYPEKINETTFKIDNVKLTHLGYPLTFSIFVNKSQAKSSAADQYIIWITNFNLKYLEDPSKENHNYSVRLIELHDKLMVYFQYHLNQYKNY